MKKLKTKIVAGLGSLFIVILLLSIIGIAFINQLSDDSSAIIRDNYASVDYSNKMLKVLDNMFLLQTEMIIDQPESQSIIDSLKNEFVDYQNDFEKFLSKESNNITEMGERQLVNDLQESYNDYIKTFQKLISSSSPEKDFTFKEFEMKFQKLRANVQNVYEMNMNAILKRNDTAENTAATASNYMGIITIISLILTFLVFIYFPNYIISPIKELTLKIKEITKQNYDQKIHIETHDELGELANSFNQMSSRLKEYEDKHIDQLLLEKKRMEALVKSMQDGVIVLDEQKHIHINKQNYSKTYRNF